MTGLRCTGTLWPVMSWPAGRAKRRGWPRGASHRFRRSDHCAAVCCPRHRRAHHGLLELRTGGGVSPGALVGRGCAALLPRQRDPLRTCVRDPVPYSPRPAATRLLPAGRREALGSPGQLRLAGVRQHRA
jgi:hypothetical protein